MSATREQMTAFVATVLGVLVGGIALYADAGLGNIIGAAFLTYVITVVVAVAKLPMHPAKVVSASGKGMIIVAVVTVLLFSSFARSLAAVISS